MTNFSSVSRSGFWTWLTPERAVLVVPILAGLGLSVVMVSAGVTPLSLRVKEQQEVVEQLTYKSDALPLLHQQLAELKQKQLFRDQQLDRLLSLVAGTSELNTFLAELDELGQFHQVSITSTEPGPVERFRAPTSSVANGQAPPAAGGRQASAASSDALLNRGLEKRSAGLSVKGPFEQVLAFLQSLERLEVFVIVSDLDVTSQTRSSTIEGEPSIPEVAMTFNIAAYGRQRPADNGKSDAVKETD